MKKNIKLGIPNLRNLLLLSAGVSFLLLSVALVGQYGFKLHPCDLCIYQRIPYVLIIMLGITAGLGIRSPKWQFLAGVVCALLFLTDAGIAGYHTGVETGVFKGPSACSSDNSKGPQSIEELRALIMQAPLVSCAQAMTYIFGLSMAAWNMIAASVCFITVSFVLFKRRDRVR